MTHWWRSQFSRSGSHTFKLEVNVVFDFATSTKFLCDPSNSPSSPARRCSRSHANYQPLPHLDACPLYSLIVDKYDRMSVHTIYNQSSDVSIQMEIEKITEGHFHELFEGCFLRFDVPLHDSMDFSRSLISCSFPCSPRLARLNDCEGISKLAQVRKCRSVPFKVGSYQSTMRTRYDRFS